MKANQQDIKQSEWYKTRPASVKKRIDEYPPDEKYKLKTTGHIVRLYSYSEDDNGECNECMVLVLLDDNPGIVMERKVFGIKFEDLERLN